MSASNGAQPAYERLAGGPTDVPELRGRSQLIICLVVGAVLGAGLTAAALAGDEEPRASGPSAPAAASPSSTPAEETSGPSPTDPVEELSPSDEFSFTELEFGEALPVVTDDASEETLAVERPTIAPCSTRRSVALRRRPRDRVVQVEIVIEYTGESVASWGSDCFVLEFRDGTQMSSSDDSAYEYGPSNPMDYSVKIRPGTKFRSTLAFEAPNAPFSILVLTSDFDGVPFAGWS